ncbi:UDP-N-acetylmuramyl-tripeptide synthetase [Patescibacteria group bacterium]|nr:MAG: UDP-N-acetylmuramyl-tripeptide synthetase [Patescibacteria group bacterium]
MFRIFKKLLRIILPKSVFTFLINSYHFFVAVGSACWYGFPSNKMTVIAVTGTKGKSSVSEMVNAILEEAGFRTALANTIRFKIDTNSSPNLFKMTMPGRGYLQKFISKAKKADCTHVVLEITSEGARQFRHIGISLDALIFTNIAPEHIESHGSFDAYKKAKLKIGKALVTSKKRPRIMVANAEDELGKKFLALNVDTKIPFILKDAEPYQTYDDKISMTFGDVTFTVPFPGAFTVRNALASASLARTLGIEPKIIGRALQHMEPIRGRAESIDAGQSFRVLVDYAHTPDSLKALYEAFPKTRKVCVLGNTGGGRDTWKRKEMGAIADSYCDKVILTNEDPYDENPETIIAEMIPDMKHPPTIIMDRRKAIQAALREATEESVVLITGKGTDPFIMEEGGKKTPWNDAEVAREEILTLIQTKKAEPLAK